MTGNKMETLTIEQINSIELTEKEQKSNEAFAKLTKVIKHYNEGWEPTVGDRGYLVYSMYLLWGGRDDLDYDTFVRTCGNTWYGVCSGNTSIFVSRLALRNIKILYFVVKEYKQDWFDLFMVDK